MSTQRKEPTLTNLFGLFGSSETKTPRVNAHSVVNDAIAAFTKAEEDLQKAASQIEDQIILDQQAIDDLEIQKSIARDELSRIERIKDRLAGLLK